MFGGLLTQLGRANPDDPFAGPLVLVLDAGAFVLISGILAIFYWLRLRRSEYRSADAKWFTLFLGVATPYVVVGMFAVVSQLGSGYESAFSLAALWCPFLPMLAGELTVRYCRWRMLPPDSAAT